MVRLIQHQRNSSGQQSWKCFIEMCELCADVSEMTTAGKRTSETSQPPIKKRKPHWPWLLVYQEPGEGGSFRRFPSTPKENSYCVWKLVESQLSVEKRQFFRHGGWLLCLVDLDEHGLHSSWEHLRVFKSVCLSWRNREGQDGGREESQQRVAHREEARSQTWLD